MYINEIPKDAVIYITNTIRNISKTIYTSVLESDTPGKVPSIYIPLITDIDLLHYDGQLSLTYFNEDTKETYNWLRLEVVKFPKFFAILSNAKGKKLERRHSSRIPLDIPCSVTSETIHCQGVVLHNLSLEGFNLTLGDQLVNIGEILTIHFEDDDFDNSFNGKVVHIEKDNNDVMHCGGLIVDSLKPMDSYLYKKQEEMFNKSINEMRSHKSI